MSALIAITVGILRRFIESGISLGLKTARHLVIGGIAVSHHLNSHRRKYRVHGKPERISVEDLRGQIRERLSGEAIQYAALLNFGAPLGIILALLYGHTVMSGANIGAAVSTVVVAVITWYRSGRLRRERQRHMTRLFNVARAEFPIPQDQGVNWWLAVRRWSTWPMQLHAKTDRPTFPALIRFRLPPDYWPSREAREDFADHLHEATAVTQNTGLQWVVTWDIPQHAVWAEISLAKIDAPYPTDWPALQHPRLIPIGKRRDGERRFWNADADPMGAIAGRTGTGKTVGIGTLVIGCARAGWDVFLVDGKMTGLGIFRNRHGVRAVAVEPDTWWAVIDRVYMELQARKRVVARGEEISGRASILLVVDEVPTVLALRKGRTADVLRWNEPRREAQRKLTEIAMQGRSLDVHYWPSGQRLAALAVEGPMRENLSALLVFRSTLVGSMQAMESTAAARLPKMPGRAVWTDVASDGEEIQVYRWALTDLDQLLPLEHQPVERAPVSLDDPRDAFGFQEVTHSG